MPTARLSIPCLLTACALAPLAAADAVSESFAAETALNRFTVTGDVAFDPDRTASADGSGSLRLGPKARAILPLRPEDGSGRVTFAVYEDGAVAPDPRLRASGAFWGVVQADGRSLVPGAFYAPFLGGDTTYAISNMVPDKDSPFGFIRYLGLKRTPGWQTWEFDFDANKGLTISCNGKAVPSSRFEWRESQQVGFNALIFSGDGSQAAGQLWIDDITVTLGGPMQVQPIPPAPPVIVPERDPALEGPAPELVAAVRDAHPRLLFTADQVPQLKALYASEAGAVFRAELDGYLAASAPPDHTNFLKDATDGQRQGYWRLPTVALHYVLTGDKASFEKTVGFMRHLLAQPNWETGGELDSGMSAANIMIGAGLALDWLWHDLEPEFREQFRQKCLYHARAMYHGGHLRKAGKVHYWQADPGNNHRWHRNAGLTSCLLAAYTGAEEEHWILAKLKEEHDYIVKWLPHDGTSHESPNYMIFGLSHLVLSSQILDTCLGTSYLQHDFFRNVPRFVAQSLTPDGRNHFNYGDMGGTGVGKLNYGLALYKCTAVHRLAAEQEVLNRIRDSKGAGWGWMGLVWYDPTLSQEQAKPLPTSDFFDDVGVLFARDAWADDGVGVMFKAGPYGGYGLNRFRNENDLAYINVAHDDPDANSFLIYAENTFLAETDRYSERKKSANHNTILINGIGQLVPGRPESVVWWQPSGDMSRVAEITALKLTPSIDVVEGEAGNSYIAVDGKRPALERFRRALVFAKGDYVLVLDDIRAPEAVDISWLMQGPDLQAVSAADRHFQLIAKDATCPFRIDTNRNAALSLDIVDSPADTKGKKLLGWKQLRMTTTTDHLLAASVYDPYGRDVTVRIDVSDPKRVVAQVTGKDIDDRWEWTPSAERNGIYTLTGHRADAVLIEVGAADRPADPMEIGK